MPYAFCLVLPIRGSLAGFYALCPSRLFTFHAFVALKLLVSRIGPLVAYSARTRVDRQRDRQTHRKSIVTLVAHAR